MIDQRESELVAAQSILKSASDHIADQIAVHGMSHGDLDARFLLLDARHMVQEEYHPLRYPAAHGKEE